MKWRDFLYFVALVALVCLCMSVVSCCSCKRLGESVESFEREAYMNENGPEYNSTRSLFAEVRYIIKKDERE